MLGWHISVFRKLGDWTSPATMDSPEGVRLAVWQTDISGIDWIYQLVEEGKAINLGGNGYPFRFTAIAEHLIPHIIENPPRAREPWVSEEFDILLEGWEGRTVIDQISLGACSPNEWLIIVAWDES